MKLITKKQKKTKLRARPNETNEKMTLGAKLNIFSNNKMKNSQIAISIKLNVWLGIGVSSAHVQMQRIAHQRQLRQIRQIRKVTPNEHLKCVFLGGESSIYFNDEFRGSLVGGVYI